MQVCTICELVRDSHGRARLYADAWLVVRLDLGRDGAKLWILPRSHASQLDAGLELHAQKITRRAQCALGAAGLDFATEALRWPELSDVDSAEHAHLRLLPVAS